MIFIKDIRKRTYTNNKKIINISNLLVYKSLREASLVENINVNTLKGHISKYPHLTNCRYLEDFLKDNPDLDTLLHIMKLTLFILNINYLLLLHNWIFWCKFVK